ncbi:MAG: hypothetical protein PHF56_01775 [Desulfuromonadaceae bacterium]|nr:hypothetical protein [Desulfuromonadaceae bacterium]
MTIDLFTPVVPDENQHSNFRVITTPGLYSHERDVLASWAEGFVDRDGKAVKEFQTTFNSTFWELYLHAAFQDLGFLADYSKEAPDFILSKDGYQIIAEATIASNPEGYPAEWERDVTKEAIQKLDAEEIVELAAVRLANAVATKHKKYVESYSKLDHVKGLPYVICVAPFEQPFFFEQSDNAIRRVLYSFDRYLFKDMPEEQKRVIFGEVYFDSFVKSSGIEIELGFFRNNRMKEVSAVIFSCCATFSKVRALAKNTDQQVIFMAKRHNDQGLQPLLICQEKAEYKETLLDGLILLLNPFAERPFPLDAFRGRDISIHFFDPDTEEYLVDSPQGFLFQRSCIGSFPLDKADELKRRVPKGKPMIPHSAPAWVEGELHKARASIAHFQEHYLAHFMGWTILIILDPIDDNWGAQAISAKVKTISRFEQFNRGGKFIHLMADDFYATKEIALEAIQMEISQYIT